MVNKRIALTLLPTLLLIGCESKTVEITQKPIDYCIGNIKEQEKAKFTYTYEEINDDEKVNENCDSYSYLVNTYYSYTKYDIWYCKVEFKPFAKITLENIIYIKCEKVRR